MANLAIALISVDRNIMANLAMDPIDAFEIVANQANSLLQAYPGSRMVVAPEYFLNTRLATYIGAPEVMSRSSKHRRYDDLRDISRGLGATILVAGTIFYKKGMRTKVGLSVCPVLQNGHIAYKYYKHFDDGGLGRNDPDATYVTKPTGPVFTLDGIVFGIDVCGDMADDAAGQRNWNGQDNTGLVQVHIVIADGGGVLNRKVQAGANGVVIYSNLGSGEHFVRQSATGQWLPDLHGPNAGRAPFATVAPVTVGQSQATGATISVYRVVV